MANKAGALHTVEGSSATRRSPRTYTHAVVGDFDLASSLKKNVEWTSEHAADMWDYASKTALEDVATADKYRVYNIEASRTFMAANPDRAAYIVGRVTNVIATVKSTPDGALQVFQWSMSERSAVKAIGTWAKRSGYRNVRVVPVQRKG